MPSSHHFDHVESPRDNYPSLWLSGNHWRTIQQPRLLKHFPLGLDLAAGIQQAGGCISRLSKSSSRAASTQTSS